MKEFKTVRSMGGNGRSSFWKGLEEVWLRDPLVITAVFVPKGNLVGVILLKEEVVRSAVAVNVI